MWYFDLETKMIAEAKPLQQEIISQATRLAPAVGGGFWASMETDERVAVIVGSFTVFYIIIQGAYLLWKWYHEWLEKKK